MPHALFLFSPVFFNDFLAFTAPSNFELLVSRLVDAAVQTASSLFLLHLESLRQLHPVFMGPKVWIFGLNRCMEWCFFNWIFNYTFSCICLILCPKCSVL
uniref:Uncharacterized protein n=1 Tax=Zea mays TaxID=4577 RepID=B8A066_MAIZE|nr:unknown [Zea mays]|eukprot:NP_001146248.1 uncharacterized protein LOC100381929 isoform 2 [Zea mays]